MKLLETPAALQAEYDLIGTDRGNYVVQEFLRWNVGNEGRSFGPSYKHQVTLGSQPAVHRVVSFPYAELARRYKDNKPYLPANEGKMPEWVVTVSVAPDNRGRTLDLVGRINLDLTMQYDSDWLKRTPRRSALVSVDRHESVQNSSQMESDRVRTPAFKPLPDHG